MASGRMKGQLKAGCERSQCPTKTCGAKGGPKGWQRSDRSDSASVSTTVWKPRVAVEAERTGERLPSRNASGSDSGTNLGVGDRKEGGFDRHSRRELSKSLRTITEHQR